MSNPPSAPEALFLFLKEEIKEWSEPQVQVRSTGSLAMNIAKTGTLSTLVQKQLKAMAHRLAEFLWGREDSLAAWLTALYPAATVYAESNSSGNSTNPAPAHSTEWLLNPAACLSFHTIKWLHQKNQFLHIPDNLAHKLYKFYSTALNRFNDIIKSMPLFESAPTTGKESPREARDQVLYALLLDFASKLAPLLADLLNHKSADNQLGNLAFPQGSEVGAGRDARIGAGQPEMPVEEVVCAEYSPQLQIELLALEPNLLLQPILDLGCGENARLVEALQRQYHLQGIGLDRYLNKTAAENKLGLNGDWLTMPLGHNAWGTIISHMGFSNHFIHHHITAGQDDQAARYAARYMEILHALKPGGAFIYAPGLPFVENLLSPEQYRITRRKILIGDGNIPTPSQITVDGQNTVYVCRVEKLP